MAPLILLGIYLYLHFNLQRLWEELANLPAVFPDGKTLDQRANPWLLNGLVCAHFVWLRDKQPALSRMQRYGSVVLAWWVVPLTLFFFWLRCLPRHEWGVTTLHMVLLVASIGLGIPLYLLATATLCGKAREPFRWNEAWEQGRLIKLGSGVLGLGVFFAFLYLLSYGAIEGVYESSEMRVAPPDSEVTGVRKWAPRVFALIGYSPFANLKETDVSLKPAHWTGKYDELAAVKGAAMNLRNLRYANAHHAFMVDAHLDRADLRGAILLGADLRQASLFWANLQGAVLSEAKLLGADLSNADLKGAFLTEANIQGTFLNGADLTGANGLTTAQIESAIIDENTRLPDHFPSYSSNASSTVRPQ